jgi:hypothetical protein
LSASGTVEREVSTDSHSNRCLLKLVIDSVERPSENWCCGINQHLARESIGTASPRPADDPALCSLGRNVGISWIWATAFPRIAAILPNIGSDFLLQA